MNVIITHAERAGWQRRAAGELATVLNTHSDLPIIGWTLASAGSGLVGQISGPAPSSQRRRVFEAWRTAMRLCPPCEIVFGDGTVALKASARRNQVRVTLTTTLLSEDMDGKVTA